MLEDRGCFLIKIEGARIRGSNKDGSSSNYVACGN